MRKLILFLIVLIPFVAHAQKKTPPKNTPDKKNQKKPAGTNPLDDKYSPGKNSVFVLKASTNNKSNALLEDGNNVLKFNPALLIRKTAAVFYERKMGEIFSAEAGLGLTYGIDIVQRAKAKSEGSSILIQGDTRIPLDVILSEGTSKGIGLFFSISPKVRYNSMFWDNNSYVELNYRFVSNRINLAELESKYAQSSVYIEGKDLVTRSHWYNLIMGSEFETEGSLVTTHEFYYGFGFCTTSLNAFDAEQKPINGVWKNVFTQTKTQAKFFSYNIMVGYIFGIRFKNFSRKQPQS